MHVSRVCVCVVCSVCVWCEKLQQQRRRRRRGEEEKTMRRCCATASECCCWTLWCGVRGSEGGGGVV